MTAKESKKFNFAQAYADLQKTVEWFEKGEVDLEEGIKKFEDGLKLVCELKKYLQTVENKVKQIKEKMTAGSERSDDKDSLF